MAELTQIDISDTQYALIYERVGAYDNNIKSIRVFGVLDETKQCKEPYFMLKDILTYLQCDKRQIQKYNTHERVKKNVYISQKLKNGESSNIMHMCNMLTKYGLVRSLIYAKDTRAGVAFRQFVYALFDNILTVSNADMTDQITNSHTNFMNMPEVQEELKQVENNSEFVYFIKNTETNRFKIGRTKNVEERLCQLQTGNDCPLVLYKIIPSENSAELETSLHNKFADYHIRGEWFSISEEQVNLA